MQARSILLLTGEYPPVPGGVGDYTRCLAQALDARGYTVTVLTIEGGLLVLYRVAEGHQREVLTAAGTGLDWSARCWPALIAALDVLRPDWLHIQYQTGAYGMQAGINLLPWRLRGLRPRLRVAVTFHDLLRPYLLPKAGPLRDWVHHRLAADADTVIATTSADAQALARYRAAHIPLGSNMAVAPPQAFLREEWRAMLGIRPDEFVVAFFGLLSPTKGAHLILDALEGSELPWRLIMIGGAATAPQDVTYASALRTRVSQKEFARRTILTGHVTNEFVSAHLLSADCMALPFADGASFRRGSLLAALTHGCPVITTTPADAATATLLREAVLFVPPGDAPALAEALRRLASDAPLQASLAAAGRQLATSFDWSTIAAQHDAIYAAA
ncbi:glycosyltransferase family 4 protein [Candidatus Chloroploca sp. Khr17]|uniref:glycosyltransferase family 4 protein n=1 Tax=Candidatus Chloroploca sp. Khr17 TaxID=2496869 RepID=UPI00101CDD38|nr:glycosyltransferase family 4 protein [Candidatus Chloroploca sp. Khr17]